MGGFTPIARTIALENLRVSARASVSALMAVQDGCVIAARGHLCTVLSGPFSDTTKHTRSHAEIELEHLCATALVLLKAAHAFAEDPRIHEILHRLDVDRRAALTALGLTPSSGRIRIALRSQPPPTR